MCVQTHANEGMHRYTKGFNRPSVTAGDQLDVELNCKGQLKQNARGKGFVFLLNPIAYDGMIGRISWHQNF